MMKKESMTKAMMTLAILTGLTACDEAGRRNYESERGNRTYQAAMADYSAGRLDKAMEGLAKATADLEAALADVPMKVQATLMVAADEIFANIVRYSGATGWTLKIERLRFPDAVRLIFCDDGKPFDPLRQRDPDTTLDAANRTIGGLGILIVKKAMSPVTYARQNGRNVLTMGLTIGA